MTLAPGRKLEGLTFHEVQGFCEEEIKAADHDLFELSNIKIYRAESPEQFCSVRSFNETAFTVAEFQAQDWVFHDQNEIAKPVQLSDERKSFTREEVLAAVQFVVGRWHYNNSDSLKIGPAVVKYLGYQE